MSGFFLLLLGFIFSSWVYAEKLSSGEVLIEPEAEVLDPEPRVPDPREPEPRVPDPREPEPRVPDPREEDELTSGVILLFDQWLEEERETELVDKMKAFGLKPSNNKLEKVKIWIFLSSTQEGFTRREAEDFCSDIVASFPSVRCEPIAFVSTHIPSKM